MRSINAAYCYTLCSVVCLCVRVGHTGESCKTDEAIEMPFGGKLLWAHIGATWRIRRIDWCGSDAVCRCHYRSNLFSGSAKLYAKNARRVNEDCVVFVCCVHQRWIGTKRSIAFRLHCL